MMKIIHCEKCEKSNYFQYKKNEWHCVDCQWKPGDDKSVKTNRMLPMDSKSILKK